MVTAEMNGATASVAEEHELAHDVCAQAIYEFLQEQARPTRDEIRNRCKDLGYETDTYQKALARLQRYIPALTEVTNESGRKAFMLKASAHNLSLTQLIELSQGASGKTKEREQYTNWYQATGLFRLEGPCVAACPDLQDDRVRVFLRNGDQVLLLPGYFNAMFRDAVFLFDSMHDRRDRIGNARYRVVWHQVKLPSSGLVNHRRPSPPAYAGASGSGLNTCESYPPGSEIPFLALVPGSHIPPHVFEAVMHMAGEYIGFSPTAAKKLGFGRFTPEFHWPEQNDE